MTLQERDGRLRRDARIRTALFLVRTVAMAVVVIAWALAASDMHAVAP